MCIRDSVNGANLEMVKNESGVNLWVGCGVMMYSYSKRLLFEYIRMLPNDSDDIVHVETDGIYYPTQCREKFIANVEAYDGKYPVAIGSELGNVKPEHVSVGQSYWMGKKIYYLYCSVEEEEIMRVNGIPKTTIDVHGSKVELVNKKFYQTLAKGKSVKCEFSSIRRTLWGDTKLASFVQTRTINPPKNLKEYY